MSTLKKSGLAAAVLVVLIAALKITALWPDRARQSADNTPPAGQVKNHEEDGLRPAEQTAAVSRPDDDTIGPAFECPDMPVDDATVFTPDWLLLDPAERRYFMSRLVLSDDPDHRLAAVLMAHSDKRSPTGQVEAIADILSRHPDHTLAFWNLVVICGRALEHTSCSDAALSAKAERIDKENSEVWALLAVYRDSRDDPRGAVAAMQRAIGSASTTVYYADHIQLFERAYAAASDYGQSQRLLQAIGELAALPLQHSQVFNACKRLAKRDFVWRRMCFDYGQIMESRARSVMTEQFGLALQEQIGMLDGRKDKADELRQRIKDLARLSPHDDVGTIFDDQINARYLEELSVHGERAALAFLRDEIERRRALIDRCL